MKLVDLTGKRFGKLTVIKRDGCANDGHAQWLCKCDCGNYKSISGQSLTKGVTVSCGCFAKEQRLKALTTHGLSKTKLDNTYYGIVARCYKKNSTFYKDYGGRGIKLCDEWLSDRSKFFEWSLKNGFKEGLTLDRIDNNKDYSPENCRWTTMKQQCRNRRSNRCITFKGETHSLIEWSEILNMPYSTLLTRLQRGWTVKKAFTTNKMKNQFV